MAVLYTLAQLSIFYFNKVSCTFNNSRINDLKLKMSIFNLLADFQVNERAMILTSDGRLYKLDPTKKFKVMLSVTLSDVTSVTISPDGGNQLVVMHLRPPSNDLVVSMTSSKGDDVIGELVGIFGSKYQKMMGRNLDVQVR